MTGVSKQARGSKMNGAKCGRIVFVVLLSALGMWGGVAAAQVYVSLAGDGSDGDSWATAYTSVEEAVDDAVVLGEDIWVAAGVYPVLAEIGVATDLALYGGFPPTGDPVFEDRDWSLYETVLDGQGIAQTLFQFGSNSTGTFSGFTITGSDGDSALDFFFANASIHDCRFEYNRGGTFGCVGAFGAELLLTDCDFWMNSAQNGAGVGGYDSTATIERCTFIRNYVSNTGGGVEFHQGDGLTVRNCLFAENFANRHGGGLRVDLQTNTTVANCTFVDNMSGMEAGGGVRVIRGESLIVNCLFEGNTRGAISAVNHVPGPSIRNCLFHLNPDGAYNGDGIAVIWKAEGASGMNALLLNASGNIDADPALVDPGNHSYHLQAGSPALDAGTALNAPSDDFDSEARPAGAAHDIGYDEFVDTDGDGSPDAWEIANGLSPVTPGATEDADGDGVNDPDEYLQGSDPQAVDTDGDGASDALERDRGSDPAQQLRDPVYVSPNGDNTTGNSWATALYSLHDAVALAGASGKDVWVAAGTYLIGSSISMPSHVAVYGGFPATGDPVFDDRNPDVHVSTLDGQGASGSLIECNKVFENHIEGLRFHDGYSANNGGAILCENYSQGLTVADCVFTQNVCGAFGAAIAVLYSSLVAVEDCWFDGNDAREGGGLNVHRSQVNVRDCDFTGNTATQTGGGVAAYWSILAVDRCLVTGNISAKGGGIEAHEGYYTTIMNCIIAGNEATDHHGGGVNFEFESWASIRNCTIVDNTTPTRGGGVFFHSTDGEVVASILVGNDKHAIFENDSDADPVVRDCVFHDNPDGVYFNEGSVSIANASGVGGLNAQLWEAEGNIDGNPSLTDRGAGDYHLRYDSPCIDATTSVGAPFVD
ncbi:MAG: hypothetical protein GWP08_17845, partial [Nitrospiraceae bacterium]|nr:hypothetical protein [Nitrospiraceae bacterium]